MSDSPRKRSIEAVARDLAVNRQRLVQIAEVASIFILPVTESMVIQQMDRLMAAGIFWWLILSLGVVHLALGALVLLASRNESFYFEHVDLKARYNGQSRELRQLERRLMQTDFSQEAGRYAIEGLWNLVSAWRSKSELSDEDVEAGLEGLMLMTVGLRHEAFNFSGISKYNFAVYSYDEGENALKVVWRKCDDRIQKNNRKWEPGRGHVGLCYSMRRTIMSSDLAQSEELAHDMRGSDFETYRSMASTPVFDLSDQPDRDEVRGVFVVTSSAPMQFDPQIHEPYMKTMSTALSLYFYMVDQKRLEGTNNA